MNTLHSLRYPSRLLVNLTLSLALVFSLISPAATVWAGTADKTGTANSDFVTTRQTTINIEFNKPTIAVEPAVELAIVIDTSGSMADTINALKTTVYNFVDTQLRNYPGAVMVGITKIGNGVAAFDSNNSNNPGANYHPMFQAGTTNPLPNNQIGVDKVVTINSSNISSLLSAINAITVESLGNPNSPDGANSYSSDIGPGINRAAGMLHSGSSRMKRVILLTDGHAVKGYCPINGSGQRASQITWPADATLQVVPGGPTNLLTSWVSVAQGSSGDPIFPSSYPTTHGEPGVCRSFSVNAFGGNLLADNRNPVRAYHSIPNYQTSLLQEIADRFPNGSFKSENITTGTLDHVLDAAKLASIVVQDTLNSAVFENLAAGSYLGLFRCGTNTSIGSATFVPSGTGFTLTIPTATVNAYNGKFCVRLRATVRSGVSSGNQYINSASGNQVRYRNPSGITLATDDIDRGTIAIPTTYTAPSNLTTSNLTCNSLTLNWTAGTGSYPYTIQVRQGSTVVASASAANASVTSVNISGLTGNTSYSWRITPSGQSTVNAPSSFTTPHCLSYTVTTPGALTIEPGSSSQTLTYNFNFTPNPVSTPSAWTGKTINLRVLDIRPASQTCSGLSYNSSARTSGSHTTTTNITVDPDTLNFSPSTSQQAIVNITVAESVPQGQYIVCLGSFPNDDTNFTGTYNRTFSNSFTVQYASWLQIDAPSSSQNTGEVHSNGSFNMTIPYSQTFFSGGLAGLVSATSGNVSMPPSRLSDVIAWRAAPYRSTITSPAYTDLLQQASSNLGQPEVRAATLAGSGRDHVLAQCSSSASKAFQVNGNLTISTAISLTNANCANANLVYFINGNLSVNQNIANDSTRATLTYVVQGDITVASTVTRLDGVYLFSGLFRDGISAQALTVKGSLIGLAGLNPSSSSGRFYNGQSGFQRDLGNGNNNPAETIIYQPKYLHRLAPLLGGASISWYEN